LFFTCLADAFAPQVAFAAVAVLERFGARVRVPLAQTCCGQPAFNAGHRREARAMAARFLSAFRGDDFIVTPSGSCAAMVRHAYPLLFRDDPVLLEAARRAAGRVFELTEFLVRVLGVTDPRSPFRGKVAYHDSCHLRRGLCVVEEPRSLLRAIPGVELVEMADGARCCGFGGVFAVRHGPVSCRLAEQKLERILETGARYVTSADLGCLFHIAGLVSRGGYPIRPLHIAEILAGTAGGAS